MPDKRASDTVEGVAFKTKRSLSEQIKGMCSNLLKALEGDHETHKYR